MIGRARQFAKRDGGLRSPRFPEKEKKEIKKRKTPLLRKNEKDTAKKMPAAGDTALTAWIDRSLATFG